IHQLASRPEVGPIGNHPAHAASWVFAVAGITRNQVDVKVRNAPTGGGALVDADVVSRRRVILDSMLSRSVKKGQNSLAFRRSCVEERFDVPLRKNETVPWRDWVGVENPRRMFVVPQNSSCGERTEDAWFARGHVFKGPGSPVVDLMAVERLEDP